MNKTYLILDCNYLCHRAKHVFGELSYKGSVTGVVYGFFKDILYFQDYFQTKHIIFCWDYGKGIRKQLSTEYKANRIKEYTEEEIEFEKAFRKQVKKVREEYLSEMGYSNIFYQKGYESDDIIASVCKNLPEGDEAIIVSADHDLYQLLSNKVSIFHPQKNELLTLEKFKSEYKIKPKRWAWVKAISGCSSDNITGIKGVGEKTAIKYLLGELKETTKTYKAIEEQKEELWKKNGKLTKLPLEGTKVFEIKEDKVSKEAWRKIASKLGMRSIKDKTPF